MAINKIQFEYNKLLEKLSNIGFIIKGSINTVFYKCSKKKCICNTDTTKRHGPYFVLTRKVKGKTVSKRIKRDQIDLYKSYIANKKRMNQIIDQMIELSIKAIEETDK